MDVASVSGEIVGYRDQLIAKPLLLEGIGDTEEFLVLLMRMGIGRKIWFIAFLYPSMLKPSSELNHHAGWPMMCSLGNRSLRAFSLSVVPVNWD
jgi:hypothetical protein